VEEKVAEYFTAGVERVRVVDPRRDQVHLHRPNATTRTLQRSDLLEEPDLLPGFRLSLAELFG
jgi:Uma2 family endonuclease